MEVSPDCNTMRHDRPNLMPSALALLEFLLTPESVVFEWGMGGSTAWIAKRCKLLVSVEHDLLWFGRVWGQCVELNNVRPYLAPEKQRYVNLIGGYDHLDVVFIDGVWRAACMERAVDKVGLGVVVVDDTQKEWGQHGFDVFNDWLRIDVYPPPGEIQTTTFFMKPATCSSGKGREQ